MVFQVNSNQVFIGVCLASLLNLSLGLWSECAWATGESEGLPERREQGGGSRYANPRHSTFEFTIDQLTP